MKTFKPAHAIAILIWALPAIYLIWLYSSLPQIVPVHYGLSGKPDRFDHRSEVAVLTGIMMAVSAGVYLLITFLPAIDPKKKVAVGEDTFQKIGLGIVFFISTISTVILYATAHQGVQIESLLLPLIGLFFAYLGNLMYSIKPNYFAGVRTPWTLEDEGNWRATHQLAGKLWFIGGILITVVMLIVQGTIAFALFIASIFIMTIIPVIFSYIYFKKHQAEN